MPLLGALLVNILGVVAGWLAKYFTQKVAVTVVVLAQLVILYAALFSLGRGALWSVGVLSNAISPMFGAGVSMVITPRVSGMLGSWFSFWVAKELFKWRLHVVQLWGRTI